MNDRSMNNIKSDLMFMNRYNNDNNEYQNVYQQKERKKSHKRSQDCRRYDQDEEQNESYPIQFKSNER